MKHEIHLNFTIADFDDITHDKLSQTLGINPQKMYVKGTKKYPDSSVATLVKRNRWIMESPLDKYSTFEAQMNARLDIIEPKIDLFKPICSKYHCEFSCAIFIRFNSEESTPWVHLNTRYNRLVKELNIEFDVDLYCLPNDES